jgi:hypothetical protein
VFLPLRPSDDDRRRAVGVLKRGYVTGRLSTETLEARLVVAETTRSRAALRALIADLSRRWLAVDTLLAPRAVPADPTVHWAVLLLSHCTDDEVVVGRGRDCQVALVSDCVSRRHARFERTSTGWSVVDLGSRNGTYVNEVRVERAPVEAGARVRVGDVHLDVV